jgi:PilZ domain
MGVEIQMSGKQRSGENRQAKRYRYRGGAIVRRLDSDPSLPGLVLELSSQGCRLRLPDLTDFEVGAAVDIAVNSRGASFRAIGWVRHRSWTRKQIGVAFLNLSRRGEADLLELIADLEAQEQGGLPGVPEITVLRYAALPG